MGCMGFCPEMFSFGFDWLLTVQALFAITSQSSYNLTSLILAVLYISDGELITCLKNRYTAYQTFNKDIQINNKK